MLSKFFTAALLVSFSISDALAGGCIFWGNKPQHVVTVGDTVIYHGGDLHLITQTTLFNIWVAKGPVWIIWGSESDALRNRFRIDGNIQTCAK